MGPSLDSSIHQRGLDRPVIEESDQLRGYISIQIDRELDISYLSIIALLLELYHFTSNIPVQNWEQDLQAKTESLSITPPSIVPNH